VPEDFPYNFSGGTRKIDAKRCFKLNLKAENDKGEVESAFEYLCVEKTYDNTAEMEETLAVMIASRWVDRINVVCKVLELEASTNFCETCIDEECMDTINMDHPMMPPIA
jgi:hypothetical protein